MTREVWDAMMEAHPPARSFANGYSAEAFCQRNVLAMIPDITHVTAPGVNNRADFIFMYKGRSIRMQIKCPLEGSVHRRLSDEKLGAEICTKATNPKVYTFDDGSSVRTGCCRRGEYNVLAVPMYAFNGNLASFAFKLNIDMKGPGTHSDIPSQYHPLFIGTQEQISYPLSRDEGWSSDLTEVLDRYLRI